jgi:hypothetical protein
MRILRQAQSIDRARLIPREELPDLVYFAPLIVETPLT